MFKKNVSVLLALVVGLSLSPQFTTFADSAVNVVVNGSKLTFDVPPILENGRTFLPIRSISSALGIPNDDIIWDNNTQTAIIYKSDGSTVTFTVGETNYLFNGISVPMDVKAELINGRVMIPLRYVAQAFGIEVEWDESTMTASINSLSGTGTITYSDGSKYTGDFKNVAVNGTYQKVPNGQGKIYDKNENLTFTGNFADGLLNGVGEQYYTSGKVFYQGDWSNGKFNGNGKLYDQNGNLEYDGQFKGGQLNGYAKAYDQSGNVWYDGEWLDNKLNGTGTENYYKNGKLVWSGAGTFQNGIFSGYGKLYDQNGTLMSVGQFQSGVLINSSSMIPSISLPSIPLTVPSISIPTLTPLTIQDNSTTCQSIDDKYFREEQQVKQDYANRGLAGSGLETQAITQLENEKNTELSQHKCTR